MTLNGIEVKRCLARNLQKYVNEGKVRSVNVARHFTGKFNTEHKPFRRVKDTFSAPYIGYTYVTVSDGRGGKQSFNLPDNHYVYYR